MWEPDEKRLALLGDILAAAPRVSRMMQDARNPRGAEHWADFAVYRLPCFKPIADLPAFKNSGNIAQIMTLTQPKTMNEVAARLVGICPNGAFILMQASWLRTEGRLAEAEAAFARAMQAPSMFPVRRVALVELTNLQFERLDKTAPASQAELRERIRANLRELAGQGSYPPQVCNNLAHFARGVGENALALVFSEAYVRQAPENSNALASRQLSEIEMGCLTRATRTINEMLAMKPKDATLLNLRGVLEFHQGFLAQATASSFEALRCDPKQPNVAGNLTIIETELRQRLAVYPVLREKLRLRAALTFAHLGQHTEAVKAIAAEKSEGDTAVALACLYAVAARSAAADSKLTPEERGKHSEEYAVKSVDLLRVVQESGYFKDSLRVNYLDGEHDFDTLRKRADFMRVMKGISN
jgi:hypothetical protein